MARAWNVDLRAPMHFVARARVHGPSPGLRTLGPRWHARPGKPRATPGAMVPMAGLAEGSGRAAYLLRDFLDWRPGAKMLGGFDVKARGHLP